MGATRSRRRRAEATRGWVGGAEASQAVNGAEQSARSVTAVGSGVWARKRVEAAEEWAGHGSVPRVTGLRMLEEPASSSEVRHGGWMV